MYFLTNHHHAKSLLFVLLSKKSVKSATALALHGTRHGRIH